jgi:hypothetical protein
MSLRSIAGSKPLAAYWILEGTALFSFEAALDGLWGLVLLLLEGVLTFEMLLAYFNSIYLRFPFWETRGILEF